MNIERVGVVGAGQMGAGIAEVSLRAGADVRIYEPTEALAAAGRDRIVASLERGVSKGKLTEAERDAALARLTSTSTLADLADRQLVVEAIVEDAAVKAKLFAELDAFVTDPDAVLASNTSSIPIMKIAAATKNPGRVLGLHFFNPVPVLPLVELVGTLVTTDAALERVEQFAGTMLGKQVVRCSDRSGFVVNALLVPYLLSAIRMAEAGVATVEDIDTAVVAGLSHPMGPLRLSDLVGLDTLKLIADSMFEEFKEPLYGAPPLLQRMVEAGQLGKKSGRGFYTSASGIIVRSGLIADDELCARRGISCTTAARTAYDIGRFALPDKGIIRIDALLNATRCGVPDVEEIAARYQGARGIRRLRATLDLVDGGAESPQETRLRLILIRGGLTRPVTQIPVADGRGRVVRRIDMGWPDWKVGVEYDGEQHWKDSAAYEDDIDRLEFLAAMGWLIVRVSTRHMRAPAGIVRRISRALHSRGWSPNVHLLTEIG